MNKKHSKECFFMNDLRCISFYNGTDGQHGHALPAAQLPSCFHPGQYKVLKGL